MRTMKAAGMGLRHRRYRWLVGRRWMRIVALTMVVVPAVSTVQARIDQAGAATRTYTLAMSMLVSGELRPTGTRIVDGARLAVLQRDQSLARTMGIRIRLRVLDDGVKGVYSGPRDARNARTFIADPTVFAEEGPYNSGAAAQSMPVYNRAGLVQVSPGNTLPDLTDPLFRARYEPATAMERVGLTYFRVCTTDAFQGPAGAAFARSRLHVKTGFIVTDPSPPGIGLAQAYRRVLPTLGIKVLGVAGLSQAHPRETALPVIARIQKVRPEAIFFGGGGGPDMGATVFADLLRARGLLMPIIAGDGLFTPTWIVGLDGTYHPGSQSSWITTIGANPLKDRRATRFTAAFRRHFHRDPSGFSVLAYDAANIEIDALVHALGHGKGQESLATLRKAVRANVAGARYHGVGGAGHFDANGDTTNKVISVWRVKSKSATGFQWLGYATGFAPHSTP